MPSCRPGGGGRAVLCALRQPNGPRSPRRLLRQPPFFAGEPHPHGTRPERRWPSPTASPSPAARLSVRSRVVLGLGRRKAAMAARSRSGERIAGAAVHERIEQMLRFDRRRYTDAAANSSTCWSVRVGRSVQTRSRRRVRDSRSAPCTGRPGSSPSLARSAASRAPTECRGSSSAKRCPRHHHHLLCRRCGVVFDYELPRALEEQLRAAALRVGRRAGFTGLAERFDIEGLCRKCTAERAS